MLKECTVACSCVLVAVIGLLDHRLTIRAADSYTFSVIELPGAAETVANGIDMLGRVVGHYQNDTGTHGFLLEPDGALVTIDFPGARWTAAFGVNNAGQIVGGYGSTDKATGRHGYLLSGGSFSSFDVPGSIDTVARGINSRGQIVGEYMAPDGVRHGFRLSGGSYASVEFPESGAGSANGINDSGQIVGLAGAGPSSSGFLFNSGSYSRITLPDSVYTEPYGVNNLGDIAGREAFPRVPFRAFGVSTAHTHRWICQITPHRGMRVGSMISGRSWADLLTETVAATVTERRLQRCGSVLRNRTLHYVSPMLG